ncbi:DNA mismatch repair protein MSH2, putative [Plasmodium malariae]|uniref:DNA mismatch repair protein MSH2, putative n=1 Tax=Plasmodium malariae TaxID=5858 RepID=A0A1A8WWU7_PLAMA|nr:DNA mismatch repair protein MSH2, putative [Plasmodium malariae]SBS96358.1 DNA mismatch repair protein MSH2, putative [Plasmodium malariae]SBT86893.1 DNA mismatch repair protein MSH2, putative [Plasmodium malariae]
MSEDNLENAPTLKSNNVISFIIECRNSIRYAGICIYNMHTNCFSLCEYIENEHLTVLESVIIQCRPTLFLYFPSNDKIDDKRIKLILDLCEVKGCELPRNYFQSTSIENDLSKLIKETEDVKNYIFFFKLELACKSLCSIIKHLNLLNDDNTVNKCILKNYNINEYMKLDKAAVVALNIYAETGTDKKKQSNNTMTLYKFLNKCKTKIGERKLLEWIMHPLRDEHKINERLDIVEIFKEDGVTRSLIQSDYLRKVCDIHIIIKKLKIISSNSSVSNEDKKRGNKVNNSKTGCTIEDLVKLYDSIIESKKIYYCLGEYKGKHRCTLERNFLTPLKDVLISLDSFLKLIELTIDLDEVQNNNFLISRKFDEELEKLANEKEEIYNLIKGHRIEVEEDINYLKGGVSSSSNSSNKRNYANNSNTTTMKEDIKLVECNTNIFLFRAVKKDITYIQQRKKVYMQVRMNKNEILFHTNKLKDLCKKYEYVLHEYNTSQEQLANKAIQVASSYWEPVVKLSKIISQIDVLCAFAFVSASSISVYVRPIVEQNGKILHMEGSRHPLVESNFLLVNNFIPNNVCMNKDDKRLNIITGPNMGGKSTYIRQIALICLMSQIGCFVPCNYAKLPICSQIMCRVGSSDIQLKGISTFFSEMIEIAAIIKNADENSLVIIDELGRGTSTYEGFGISWSIAHYILTKIKCFCLFATHFHEMSNLETEYIGCTNNHVGAKIDTQKKKISFLYEVKKGYADKSYGVHVAQIAKLPQSVIDKAFEKSKELESVENRHYFKTKLQAKNQLDRDQTDIYQNSQKFLNDIFSASDDYQFVSAVKQNAALLNEMISLM